MHLDCNYLDDYVDNYLDDSGAEIKTISATLSVDSAVACTVQTSGVAPAGA